MINFLTGLALVGAAATAIACAIAKLIIENGKCRIEDHSQFLARQSHLTAVVSAKAVGDGGSILHSKFSINGAAFVFFAAIATLFAQKTNSPPRGGSVELRVENEKCRVESVELRGGQSHNSTLYNINSQLPFRLESVTTNDSYSYVMPANGIRYDRWWNHGAYI